eukprot:5274279-Lingulodinium_polyedra.AAC.1
MAGSVAPTRRIAAGTRLTPLTSPAPRSSSCVQTWGSGFLNLSRNATLARYGLGSPGGATATALTTYCG